MDDIFSILAPGSPLASDDADAGLNGLEDVTALEQVALNDSVLLAPMTEFTVDLSVMHSPVCSAAEESAQDPFDVLDAILEAEFPMGGALSLSPTEYNCWAAGAQTAAQRKPSTPISIQPAVSSSVSHVDTHLVRSPVPWEGNLPANTETAAPLAAKSPGVAAAALKAASSAAPVDLKPMPRWKVYHMQQKQELLGPKQSVSATSSAGSPAISTAAGIAAPPAAAFPAVSRSSSPSAASGVTSITLPVCRADSVTSGLTVAGGVLPALAPSTAVAAEHMLLLNAWKQQQQMFMQQQQQMAQVTGAKRSPVSEVSLPQAKRCRTAAAGSVAAQHLFGLPAEPPLHLQQLQASQLPLQAQLQQKLQQQQVQQYQQQQIRALHQQLHLRLQAQQHHKALQMLHSTAGRQTAP